MTVLHEFALIKQFSVFDWIEKFQHSVCDLPTVTAAYNMVVEALAEPWSFSTQEFRAWCSFASMVANSLDFLAQQRSANSTLCSTLQRRADGLHDTLSLIQYKSKIEE